MGAPKQKWTSEEESALKSGVIKHGVGKWRTILKDPEYNSILFLRSNVDLKDKWRNMSVTANGWGSRDKARMALRRSHHHHHHHTNNNNNISHSDDEDMLSDTSEEVESDDEDDDDDDDEIVAEVVKPLTTAAVSTGMLQIAAAPPPPPTPRQPLSRLETLIMEAITSLKEPSGSNKTSIAVYIEDQYNTPPNFKRILSAKVKGLASSGKLIKVNRKYRIAPSASSFSGVRRSSPAPAAVIAPPPPPPLSLPPPPVQAPAAAPVPTATATVTATIRIEKEDMRNLMKSQIDAELAKMRSMSVQEAGAAAARAVAEAEAAMAEAEEAAREAEAAEADADAAQAFAEAAMTTLRSRYSNNLMVRG